MFSKAIDYFRKMIHRKFRLSYKYASLLTPDLKLSYDDFLLWKHGTYYSSMVKVSDKITTTIDS